MQATEHAQGLRALRDLRYESHNTGGFWVPENPVEGIERQGVAVTDVLSRTYEVDLPQDVINDVIKFYKLHKLHQDLQGVSAILFYHVHNCGWSPIYLADKINVGSSKIYAMSNLGRVRIHERMQLNNKTDEGVERWTTRFLDHHGVTKVPFRRKNKKEGITRDRTQYPAAQTPLMYMDHNGLDHIRTLYRRFLVSRSDDAASDLCNWLYELHFNRKVPINTLDVAVGRPFGWTMNMFKKLELVGNTSE